MATVSYPGIYIEEQSSGVRPIAVAGSSTAAFVGLCEMGPEEATCVTNWTEFARLFGGAYPDSYLASSVYQYFNNGGRQCYIVRAVRTDATTATVTVQNRADDPHPALTISARSKGKWGNCLYVTIEDGTRDPGNEFRISVRRQADPLVVPADFRDTPALEVHDNLSVNRRADNYVATVLAQQSSLVDAQVPPVDADADHTHGVYRGGWKTWSTQTSGQLTGPLRFQIDVDGDGPQEIEVTDSSSTPTPGSVATAITGVVSAPLHKRKTTTPDAAFGSFHCTVEARLVLRSATPGSKAAVQVVPGASHDTSAALGLDPRPPQWPVEGPAPERGVLRGAPGPGAITLGNDRTVRIALNGDAARDVELPQSVGSETTLDTIADELEKAVRSDAAAGTPQGAFSATAEFRLVLTSGSDADTSSVRVGPAGVRDATPTLGLEPAAGGHWEAGSAVRRPANGSAIQLGDAAETGPVTHVDAGSDGDHTNDDQTLFSGAFWRLDTVTDVSVLAVPGEGHWEMAGLGMSYCANRPLQDMFYLAETSPADDTVELAKTFADKITPQNSYGALYFPWVAAIDPVGPARGPVLLPPTGFVAGIYSRIDGARGVWKAPAGIEAGVNGAIGLAVELGDVDHGVLNPVGVNVIRRFPGAGIVSFGARTLTADPAWTYVPVRRTAIMLRVSIQRGIRWAVFEPNDETLWSQLRLAVGSFMTTLHRQGAFAGATAAQAFFVKCDRETTPDSDVRLGIVNVLVGFAPQRPAEFVVVRISQQAGQA